MPLLGAWPWRECFTVWVGLFHSVQESLLLAALGPVVEPSVPSLPAPVDEADKSCEERWHWRVAGCTETRKSFAGWESVLQGKA